MFRTIAGARYWSFLLASALTLCLVTSCGSLAQSSSVAAAPAPVSVTPGGSQVGPPPGIQYLSPKPGSTWHPPGSTVAVRYGGVLAPGSAAGQIFDVNGTSSGHHVGSVALSDDGLTLIFRPDHPFAAGETVNVSLSAWQDAISEQAYPPAGFSFSITPQGGAPLLSTTGGKIIEQHSAPATAGHAGPVPSYLTVPADFPAITVTVPASDTGAGLIFASNFALNPDPSGYYLMILDNQGQPVFYQQMPENTRSLDFTAQPDGTLSYSDAASNSFIVMDNTYHVIRQVRPGNGYPLLDEHDLQVLPNGHYLLFAAEARSMDLSQVVAGGKPDASVTGEIIQELDKNGNVVFQWRQLDYIPVTDTSEALTVALIDYSHANSIALDTDGNLVLSSRHLDEITKIDHQTGAVIWRMGGKGNQFSFASAPGVSGPAEFYHQHDVRVLPNGHFTVFDNHNFHQPQISRALEYAVDEQAKTATLVWEYQTTPGVYADAMGNVQRLPNGDSVVDWGTVFVPNISEVRPDGTRAFELDFGGPDVSYRAFRFPWHGYPTWPPALVLQDADNQLTLTFSWNGATDVTSYKVYGGNASPPNQLVGEQPKSAGFETSLVVPDAQNAYCYYQVLPVDANGKPTQPSAVARNPAATNPACAATPTQAPAGQTPEAQTPAPAPQAPGTPGAQ